MYKIGVVGPNPLIERILSLEEEYKHELQFVSFPCTKTEEVEEIVKKNCSQVQAWLFSGPIPYEIAKKTLGTDEKMVYIPVTESGFYKSYFELAFDQGKLITRLSVDSMSTVNSVEEATQQLSEKPLKIYMKVFKSNADQQELLRFHEELWKEGKTDGVLSCFPAVCKALREQGIPAYWMSFSKMRIRQTLGILAEKVKTSYFKDTQIGIEIIEIEHFNKIKEKAKSPYDLQHLELRLKGILIKLCEKLNGSLIEKGNGQYMIFSSRGTIEREISALEDAVQKLAFEADTTVTIGIGFGETVFSAERNAFRAIQHSKEMTDNDIVIIQEDGTIVESPGKNEELLYSNYTTNEDLMEKLKKCNVGVKTYKKITALVERMGWDIFTTKDLAVHLQMTERYVRRIVSDMCDVDLVRCIGETSHSTRGRQSKLYQLS
ncbi:hypothetical protein [Peribacillus butanolivorans]|uniref:hypothetical protein n=1 Tax=Peribacillus butanolivorans TaxID=421767 RepID=UPI003684BBB7